MSSEAVISVHNLSKHYRIYNHPVDRIRQMLSLGGKKHYREFTALDDIHLDIRRGETVGIVGRNGSGKSTLLQLVCGILKPTAGEVQVNGRIAALLELGAGFHPEFSGRENIYMQAAIMNISREEADKRLPEIAAFADIGDFLGQPVKTYSSGMFVRLAFAVAIAMSPDILIVDEALSVGDALFQAKCFAKFREFKTQGVTILFVTHSLDLITSHCDTAFMLDRGVLAGRGSPKEVVDQYRRHIAIKEESRQQASFPTPAQTALEWPRTFELNPAENRYGSGEAEIREAGLFTENETPSQIFMRNAPFSIRLHIHAHHDVASPIVSFVIKDVKGTVLCGTTTLMEHLDLGPLGSGKRLMVAFRQIMRLNPGNYLLSVGCQTLGEEGYIPYDVRLDLIAFQVVSDGERPGVFDPESTIEWRHLNDLAQREKDQP
ncbi:MAG TPA: ABC transporter ATP-binding protein [Betaproteobacteria bacterium]|nr:ABC transporter ATP-binding protein [Betaproteobacteria bacterium]